MHGSILMTIILISRVSSNTVHGVKGMLFKHHTRSTKEYGIYEKLAGRVMLRLCYTWRKVNTMHSERTLNSTNHSPVRFERIIKRKRSLTKVAEVQENEKNDARI